MPSTIAEKILARVSGQDIVRPGDEIKAKPDFVIAYDFPGYTDVIFRQMKEEFGMDRVPKRRTSIKSHVIGVTKITFQFMSVGVLGTTSPPSLVTRFRERLRFTSMDTFLKWELLALSRWVCANICLKHL